jgi:hypothetical protein
MKRAKLKAVPEESVLGRLLRQLESVKASVRAEVEHPFPIEKNLFHFRPSGDRDSVRMVRMINGWHPAHAVCGFSNCLS